MSVKHMVCTGLPAAGACAELKCSGFMVTVGNFDNIVQVDENWYKCVGKVVPYGLQRNSQA